MPQPRHGIAGLSGTRILLYAAPLVIASCGAGAAAVMGWSAARRICATAAEYTDSLTSNRERLAAVDSVLLRYDLLARPAIDSALEMKIFQLRMEGVTGSQMDRWLATAVQLPRRAGASAASDSGGMLARIHAHENDAAYLADLRKKLQLTNDYAHDLTVLTPLAVRWSIRCASGERRTAIAVPIWAVANLLLLLLVGWWAAARRGGS